MGMADHLAAFHAEVRRLNIHSCLQGLDDDDDDGDD